MKCPSCAGDAPSGFPGAVVTCGCGARITIPPATAARPLVATFPGGAASLSPASTGGPYRGASAVPPEGIPVPCPFCGNDCPPLVRVCPHCDVRLDNIRCVRCYSLQSPGVFDCVRCGQALELEAVLDVTDAPCPRCRSPLESSGGDARLHECPRCGGMFVPREALAEILARAELGGSFLDERRKPPALESVTYIPCPVCQTSMNRVNFGKLSGVIVDVCRSHGTWFDAGELTRIVAFAASGGLAKTRARELAEKKEEGARNKAAQTEAFVANSQDRYELETRARSWSDFLHTIFFW